MPRIRGERRRCASRSPSARRRPRVQVMRGEESTCGEVARTVWRRAQAGIDDTTEGESVNHSGEGDRDARCRSAKGTGDARGGMNQRNRLPEVILKARAFERIVLAEEIAEADAVDERPAGIPCEHPSAFQHVAESRRPPGRDHEHAESVRLGVLIFLVELHLPPPAVIRVSGPHGLRSVIDLDEVGEPRRRIELEREGGVGIQVVLSHA